LETCEESGVARFGQRADQIGGAIEEDVVSALDGLDAERGRHVGLAGTDRADDDDVSRGGYPRAASEVLDARPLETVRAPPVELRECLSRGQTCGVQTPLGRVLGARRDLGLEHGSQEGEWMLPIGKRLASESVGLACDGRQLEHARVRPHRGEHDIGFVLGAHAEHLAASSNAS
jgi:hypothetical protein